MTNSPVQIQIGPQIFTRPRVDAQSATSFGPRAPIPGDLDHDGVVGPADLGLLLAAWEAPLPTDGRLHLADIDIDFTVGSSDLGLLLSLWSN